MAKAADLIRAHQLIIFFAIAIGLMFAFLFPAIYLIPTDSDVGQIAQMYSARVAVFSPVLAGMFVTRIADSTEQTGSRKNRWISFTAVWVIATAVRSIEFKSLRGVPIDWNSMVVIGGLEALLPALVFSSPYSRVVTARKYLETLVQPTGMSCS